jgi:hypothetical protein
LSLPTSWPTSRLIGQADHLASQSEHVYGVGTEPGIFPSEESARARNPADRARNRGTEEPEGGIFLAWALAIGIQNYYGFLSRKRFLARVAQSYSDSFSSLAVTVDAADIFSHYVHTYVHHQPLYVSPVFDPHYTTARHIVYPTLLSLPVATLLFARDQRIAYRRRAFPLVKIHYYSSFYQLFLAHLYLQYLLSEVRAPPGPDSPTSSWIHFLRDEVSPLEERENEITIYPSLVGFKNAKVKTNYIDHPKKVLEGILENEREELRK